jgi:hypothetical protein
MGLTPITSVVNKSGQFEHPEMLGDSRLRYPRTSGERMHRQFSITGQALEKRPARGIGEGSKQNIRTSAHANP